MKHLIVLTIFLYGCGIPRAQPIDQVALGKQLASYQVASSAHTYDRINQLFTKDLFRLERFHELDAYLDRMAQTDPVETLCTPASLFYDLTEIQPGIGHLAWMRYYSTRWQTVTPRGWGDLALAISMTWQAVDLLNSTGNVQNPTWEQGLAISREALKVAERGSQKEMGRGFMEYQRNVNHGNPEILECIHRYPQEIALYRCLKRIFHSGDRAAKLKQLAALGKDSPASYALFFTIQLPGSVKKIPADGWEWPTLQAGFEKLLADHPGALGVRNAYAIAAHAFGDDKLAGEQAAKLGYLWDPYYWGSLSEYQKALEPVGDYHVSPSDLQPLRLDPELKLDPSHRFVQLEGQDLLEKGQWEALETFLLSLPTTDLRYWARVGLESPYEEDEASYVKQEKLLRNWQTARPESLLLATCLGGFYISYAWLARGDGMADTVSSSGWQKFHQRLQTADKFLNGAPAETDADIPTLVHKMTLYKALSFHREGADQLALAALRKGAEGTQVLLEYFQTLLPRWQGKPQDLVSAANQLRQKNGNDDAYALMALVAYRFEGDKAMKVGSPCYIDWARATDALVAAGEGKRLDPEVVYRFLWYCHYSNLRKEAARVLPYAPTMIDSVDSYSMDTPITLTSARAWAAGETEARPEGTKYSFKSIAPLRQKATRETKMGFTMKLSPPHSDGFHYAAFVYTPELRAKDGKNYHEFALVQDAMPMSSAPLTFVFQPGRLEELRPGKYRFVLEVGEKVIHEQTFVIVP